MFEPLMWQEWLQREPKNPFTRRTPVQLVGEPDDIEAGLARFGAAMQRKYGQPESEAA